MTILPFNFTPNLKVLIVPISIIGVVLVLSLVLVQRGISPINGKIKEFSSAQEEEAALTQKLNSLKSASIAPLDSAEVAVVALPEKNPGMWLVSQAKKSSSESQVDLSKITISNQSETDEIVSSELSLEFEVPDYPSFLTFIKNMTVILPIYSLTNVELERKAGLDNLVGEINSTYHWSGLPKNLPPLTQALEELSSEETDVLAEISNYKLPTFSNLTPSEPQERSQPFN
jgi:hypothetical protein